MFVGSRWLQAFPDACVRCLQAVDSCKDAALTSMLLNSAGKPDVQTSKAAFSRLSRLEDSINDTFGGALTDDHRRIITALHGFEAAVYPADGLTITGASTAASIDADRERLSQARHDLRRAILFVAERNWLFRLYGRHQSTASGDPSGRKL